MQHIHLCRVYFMGNFQTMSWYIRCVCVCMCLGLFGNSGGGGAHRSIFALVYFLVSFSRSFNYVHSILLLCCASCGLLFFSSNLLLSWPVARYCYHFELGNGSSHTADTALHNVVCLHLFFIIWFSLEIWWNISFVSFSWSLHKLSVSHFEGGFHNGMT